MLRFFYYIFIGLFLGLGCSDYTLLKKTEKAPEILVSHDSFDFGNLKSGFESAEQTVSITNIGNARLLISSIFLSSTSENFSLSGAEESYLDPGQSTSLQIQYSPQTYESNSSIVYIDSNDIETPRSEIALLGLGDAPVIDVSPEDFDFGNKDIECEYSTRVLISNIGNVDLEIFDIEYFSTTPNDLWSSDIITMQLLFPIALIPGETIDIDILYSPVDNLDDQAYLEIISDDPYRPVIHASQIGNADYQSVSQDIFLQESSLLVDILFVIDNSGSMNSNQTNLKNNFNSFVGAFSAAGVDYHMAIITTDQDSFVGPIINLATPDPVLEFNNQIDLTGVYGSGIEKGLWYSYQSTSSGDASYSSSSGFLRTAAKLVVVYVSDEKDWSQMSSSMSTSDYSSHLLSLKTSPSLVVAHAVAGDYPSGCSSNGNADFGDGYYDVVADLGGTFMSICAADWSVTMDTLARDSIGLSSFMLSEKPIENTIIVKVDGVITYDWTCASVENSVVFLSPPEEESEIIIDYSPVPECEETR